MGSKQARNINNNTISQVEFVVVRLEGGPSNFNFQRNKKPAKSYAQQTIHVAAEQAVLSMSVNNCVATVLICHVLNQQQVILL